jgi:uncharacterized membrane protein YfcA
MVDSTGLPPRLGRCTEVPLGETVAFWTVLALAPLILIVAGAYASVGLGGGTGYLAILSLVGLPPTVLAPTALLLNVLVTAVALVRFGVAGRLRWRLLLPFLLPALPAAFAGGLVHADPRLFMGVLAVALALAAFAMMRSAAHAVERNEVPDAVRLHAVAIPAGLAIGFVSGFLGIGGGVFLGPLVLLLGWAGPRQTAAMNALLILTVSAVALVAHGLRGGLELHVVLPLGIAALVGGLIGATLAERSLSAGQLQRLFAVIVLVAAARAAWDALAR